MPSWKELLQQYSQSPYVQETRKNLLAELLQKYSKGKQQNLIEPQPSPAEASYGKTTPEWQYGSGMLTHNQEFYGGSLATSLGAGKLRTHWQDDNDDVSLTLGTGGNHDIKWTHSF